jgi:hypothetical protein
MLTGQLACHPKLARLKPEIASIWWTEKPR